MRNFIGRESYLKLLHTLWQEGTSKLVAIYGRRRVGKTALIQTFAQPKKAYLFEALEGEDTPTQIRHFLHQLSQFVGEPYLRDLAYKNWPSAFDLLTEKIAQEKSLVICFDELPWMANGRTELISYIKFYWDRYWKKHPHLLFILCGSIASWIVKNVVRSQALYGRISENILLEPLKPFEVAEFVGKKRGEHEVLEYLLCFGGIPKYLEEFDFNRSIQLNIERTCFQRSGFFKEEADKIFYSQFKETQTYQKIAHCLQSRPLALKEIAKHLNLPSSGGVKLYVDNLIAAGIIDKLPNLQAFHVGKTYRYYLADEVLRLHAQFIAPHLMNIEHSTTPVKFEKITHQQWFPFLGYAFERFCLKHRYTIAALLDFRDKVRGCGTVLNNAPHGFQYDLVYLRSDRVITLCETKYLSAEPSTKYIKEFENKLTKTNFPKHFSVEKVFICNQEPSKALRESGYFHRFLCADQIVKFKS